MPLIAAALVQAGTAVVLQWWELVWLAVGAVLALAAYEVGALGEGREPRGTRPDQLRAARVELTRRRRSGTSAEVLFARVQCTARRVRPAALGTLRITDGVAVVRSRGECAVIAVFDAADSARVPVERRLRREFGEVVSCGWASFPAEGTTLEALLERAAARATPRATGRWGSRGKETAGWRVAIRGPLPARPTDSVVRHAITRGDSR
jgi:hypothetical protein